MRHVLRIAFASTIALSLAACSGSSPSSDTPGAATASFQQTVPAGTPVYVNRGGQWVPATVVRQTGPTNVLIHYEGMPVEWDEDVVFDRVRSRPASAAPAALYKVGEVVIVRTQNRLFLADVAQQVDAQTYRVHYAGYGAEAVENVTLDRIQRPFAGQTAYPTGAPLLVDTGAAQPLPAKVLAVVAADQWIVRFDSFGPQYDQQIGADRVRPPQAAPAVTTPPVVTAPPAATTPPTTPTAKGTGTPPVDTPPPLKVGDAVLVQVKRMSYPAKITAAGAAGAWKVRLDGQSADEEVAADRVAHFQAPLKNAKYKAGQLVFIEWHGVYAPGKVIKEVDAGNYKIRVDGASPDADEIVLVRRLRPR